MSENSLTRRSFLKGTGMAVGGSLASGSRVFASRENENKTLQVWSCGGLAEAFIPANSRFQELTGNSIAYTGAFAGALGKSLLGNAKTEVFAPRVLKLAQKLKAEGKMLHFSPLCYTKYVLVTPKGNPAGISHIKDLAKPGLRTVIAPEASPPGGKASMIILKKAGVLEQAKANAVTIGDCVQRVVPDIVSGKGDVAVVEMRLTKLPDFEGKLEIIEIPEKYYPPVPIPFSIGVMKWAKDRELAEDFVKFILSNEGQGYFAKAGFIPARSEEGERLTDKFGVKDA